MTALRLALPLLILLTAFPAFAKGERAGDFDYYVLALSWSPNWCAREGDSRQSEQCAEGLGHGWTLHGLWPQFRQGYPSYCKASEAAPSRKMTAGMSDIMGTAGLAWHQWNKHGSCTGLSATKYFTLSREALSRVKRPKVFRDLDRTVRLPASVVEGQSRNRSRRADGHLPRRLHSGSAHLPVPRTEAYHLRARRDP